MRLTNKQRIANVLNTWDTNKTATTSEWRYAGYLEALLQSEGVLGVSEQFLFKSFTFKRLIFPGTYQVKETYPELMYRLANEYLRETAS